MSDWQKYQHLERLDSEEVEGILDMAQIWVEPKIDGANASVILDQNGILRAAKRSQVLGDGTEFRGLVAYVYAHQQSFLDFFAKYPNTIIYGEWLCLSGDTVIRKTSGGKNANYMTLREMYRFSQQRKPSYTYTLKRTGKEKVFTTLPWWEQHGYPSLFSLDLKVDQIVPNKMKRIVYTGDKEVYELITREGFKIKSSKDHRFLTNRGWTPLQNIEIGDVVAVSDLVSDKRPHRRLGKGSRKIIALWDQLRKKGICGKCGTKNSLTIHHKDENYLNNDPSNLEVLCWSCHCGQHTNNLKSIHSHYSYRFDKVVSVNCIGVEDCYDIEMEGGEPKANFVANGFVVHNCKHSIKYYRDGAWNKFYAFDVLDLNTFEYIQPDTRVRMLAEFGIEMVTPIVKIVGPIITDEDKKKLQEYVESNRFLIDEPNVVGEGVTIKAYDKDGKAYRNKYGRITWAKIVRQEFKEKNAVEFGAREVELKEKPEQIFADTFITSGRVEKCKQKIADEEGTGWNSKYIGKLLGMVYYDAFREELPGFVKEHKVKKMDFSALNQYCVLKVKSILGL